MKTYPKEPYREENKGSRQLEGNEAMGCCLIPREKIEDYTTISKDANKTETNGKSGQWNRGWVNDLLNINKE